MESRWILYKIVDCGLFHMESTWSPGGVHMECVGEGKVHIISDKLPYLQFVPPFHITILFYIHPSL